MLYNGHGYTQMTSYRIWIYNNDVEINMGTYIHKWRHIENGSTQTTCHDGYWFTQI